jgi:RimJ/RimL family protein N-acetyltransferase
MDDVPLKIRFGEESDQKYLMEWFLQPGVLEWFPLTGLREIEDAARICMSYVKQGALLTAVWDGIPCGIANLYLQPYKKLAHQALFAILVDERYRGKGVGTRLLEDLIALGKERFHLELIHLEVYEGNPAIRLYQRFGFEEYGVEKRFVKDQGRYLNKIMMQKVII